jgi:CIC family chloride channel protein
MVSNTIAYLISRQYQHTSLFDLLSKQDGMDLPSMEERREEVALHVEDAMRPYQGPVLDIDETLRAALALAEASSEVFVFVQDRAGRWYGVQEEELRRLVAQFPEGAVLRTGLPREELPHLHPDHMLDEALRRMGDWPLLPVVNRADFRKLEGVIGLHDALAAYNAVGPTSKPALEHA